jgi:hypothetical protein
VKQCNGIEAFDSAPAEYIEDPELLLERPRHSLSHYLPSTDLQLMPENLRSLGWKAINLKERIIDEGRLFEAYKSFPSLEREARFSQRCTSTTPYPECR